MKEYLLRLWNRLKNKEWFKAALYRAGWTFLQVVTGGFTADKLLWELDWKVILGTAISATVYSFIMSIFRNLPELQENC